MKKIFSGIALCAFFGLILVATAQEELAPTQNALSTVPPTTTPALPKKVDLPVPHIWEIPDGVWVRPWSNACEEASVVMVEDYYLKRGEVNLPAAEIKKKLWPLFAFQDHNFGSNGDTNSTRTLKIIEDFSSMHGTIKKYPTLEDIKKELAAGYPVISFHYGYDLKNPEHRFRRGGSSYHVMVITGYDDAKSEFMINDSELKRGLDYRYKYDTILNTLHDFDHATHKADGEPVVIFTRPKEFVKVDGRPAVYHIVDGVKHPISSGKVFKNHRWSYKAIRPISEADLAAYPTGEPIEE